MPFFIPHQRTTMLHGDHCSVRAMLLIAGTVLALAGGGACSAAMDRPGAAASPAVRVCLSDSRSEIRLGVDGPVFLSGGGRRMRLDSVHVLVCRKESTGLRVEAGGTTTTFPSGALRCHLLDPERRFTWEGRQYGDTLLVATDGRTLFLIDILPVETYLPSVVTGEMGRNRSESETAALQAQAVLARTLVLRKIDTPLARLFDVYADARDQLFSGAAGGDVLATRAVRETQGVTLACDGKPAEAFFHSCCGGSTDNPAEVWERSSASTCLQAVREGGSREAPCRIAPSYRWMETWSRRELETLLRVYLPSANEALRSEDFPSSNWHLLDLRILQRTSGGRVQVLEVRMGNRMQQRSYYIRGDKVRLALRRPADHKPLRSARFDLALSRDGEGWIDAIHARGAGNGHGVGMCQWGAIGRAREGAHYHDILAAYYPGATLVRRY